jgi:flagellar hook-associated protein 3 FlgL
VSINNEGYIVIKDNVSGSSKLDFHLVGSSDDVADIDNLVSVKAFIKSGLNPAAAALADESALYDRTMFIQNGDNVTSNVSQILKDDNSFAVASTKLQDVFSDLSSTLHIGGNRIDGSAFNIDISFGSPAAVSGDYAYNIADGAGNDTDGADMTYGQLMDVINMAMNNITPADNNAGYQSAINNANLNSTVKLTSSGKIEFTDLNNEVTQSALTIYDNNSDDFSNTNGAMATFNTNNALSIRDPKMDFFNVIDQAIVAVKEGRHYPDGNATDPRNGGVENAIAMLDDLLDHVGRRQTESGAHSNSLVNVQERTDMLLVSTMTLRSEVLDVDIAQAYTRLEQLSLNQQALLSTVSRISQLSLVNYL